MPDSPLVKRLQIKPGYRLRVTGAPDGYLERLGSLPEGAAMVSAGAGTDFVQVFVEDSSAFHRLVPEAIAAVRPDGVLWISYPKLTSALAGDLSRDVLWELAEPLGWHPVSQIAIDETWSALRFKPS